MYEYRKQLVDKELPVTAHIGKEYTPGTLTRYETAYRHNLSYLQWKYKADDMPITKLDYEFISNYEFWLKSTRNCDHNSTMKYLSNFRKIVNICIRNGWLLRNPFMGFKMTKREVEREALTDRDLVVMTEASFSAERLNIDAALKIIDKYVNHPQCLVQDRVLPVLRNQKMNAFLKEIADVCGIRKTLTYHIARHTVATTVTLSNGVPIETVSKMIGIGI